MRLTGYGALVLASLLVTSAGLAHAAAGGTPITLSHSGYLLDVADQPLTTSLSLTFRVVASGSGAGVEWAGTCAAVAVSKGFYSVDLGSASCPGSTAGGLDATLDTSDLPPGSARWLEVEVGGVTLLPRLAISSAPAAALAARALTADLLGTHPAGDFAIAADLATVATSGHWDDLAGKPATFAPAPHGHVAGDVTGLATVATSGSYNDLTNKPVIAAGTDWTKTGTDLTYTAGKVGIGSTTPKAALDVGGGVKIANDTAACAPDKAGTLRYVAATKTVELCEGADWVVVYNPAFTATGGTITQAGGKTIHTFTTNGIFTPARAGTVEVLIVGGGGAGGSSLTGGGGGGAVLHIPAKLVAASSYNIVVGAGGIGVANTAVAGGAGGSSSAFGETATGGAGAVGRYTGAAPTGYANGGGGASDAVTNNGIGVAPPASPGVVVYAGNNGGQGGGSSPNYPGGGGGGAGGPGNKPASSSAAGGNGGPGIMININGSNLYWGGGGGGSAYTGGAGGGAGGAGGGGGGSANSGPGGAGGTQGISLGAAGVSGGGNSSAAQAGGAAGANTGGGGGAGNHEPGSGGNGGSGIVIVRY